MRSAENKNTNSQHTIPYNHEAERWRLPMLEPDSFGNIDCQFVFGNRQRRTD